MKRILVVLVALLALAHAAAAGPARVAVMDFTDQTGAKPDALVGGAVSSSALAAKGVHLLGRRLLEQGGFTLIDRRDFFAQMEKLAPKEAGGARPSFIQAAQALNADVVLRGSLLSFSTSKQTVDQGGYRTDSVKLSVRVGLDAIDPADGSVVAMVEAAEQGAVVRQTAETRTELSEDDVLDMMDKAIAKAVPELAEALAARQAREEARPKVRLSVKTSADPALVEIDGILVGSTPLEGFELVQGDHVLTVGKPGYRDITKRILFEKDTAVEVPMLRTELSADEWKQVLEKARMHLFNVDPGIVVTTE